MEFRLFGEHPLGFHAVNLGLHIACVVLVFGWLRRRVGTVTDAPGATRAAGIGAALFSLHPSRPESVTWISGCTDLWMAFFVLVALTLWDRKKSTFGLTLVALALGLATLAKETAIVAPFALVTDVLLLSTVPTTRKRDLRAAIALCVSTVAIFSLRFALPALHRPRALHESVPETAQRIASSLGHYIHRTVWHIPPTIEVAPERYDAFGHAVFAPWSIVLGVMGALGLVAFAVGAWRNARLRPWFADTLWYAIPLAPVMNFVPLQYPTLIAPRFLYLPLLGVCAVITRALAVAESRRALLRGIAVGTSLVAITVFGAASIGQVTRLLDENFWVYEYALHPDDLLIIQSMVRLRSRQHDYPAAFRLLRRGIAVANAQSHRAYVILFTVTVAAEEVKQTPDSDQRTLHADLDFLNALAGPPGTVATLNSPHGHLRLSLNPAERHWIVDELSEPYQLSRAAANARTLDFSEAERLLLAMLRTEPRSALAWRDLLLVYVGEDRLDEALRAADRAYALLPDDTVVPMLRARIARGQTQLRGLPEGSPERAVAYANLCIDLGQRELARRTLAPLLARDPTRADALAARARADETEALALHAPARLP